MSEPSASDPTDHARRDDQHDTASDREAKDGPVAVGSLDAPSARDAVGLLDELVAEAGGQARDGQRTMAAAVGAALHEGRHLVVEAPTGIGKTWALACAAACWLDTAAPERPDRRIVLTTATRALQDQLVFDDLPRVAAAAARRGQQLDVAVLKGRSNYLCLAKVDEAYGSIIDTDRDAASALADAADDAEDGERSSLPEVADEVWRRLSSGSDECPGARDCSNGEQCWAERARRRAGSAEVVVVNSSLYAAHLLAGASVLPPHAAVIVDEAHALGDILVSAGSVQITPARLRSVERSARSWVDASVGRALGKAADGLSRSLADCEGVVDAGAGELAVHLDAANAALVDLARATADAAADRDDPAHDAAARAASATTALVADLASVAAAAAGDEDRVVWVERSALHAAPIDATDLAAALLWPAATVVATSGTLRTADLRGAPTFATFLARLGAPAGVRTLAVDSPFDHRRQGLLYVPRGRVPSPKEPGWADAVVDELWLLAVAAGGRTLALFTSRAATERAADALRERAAACEPGAAGHDLEVLTQWDGSRQRLLDALRRRRRVVLCATRSFWTGIDIAGDACVVVAIDRVPFPRPDDPVAQARRQRAEQRGERSFEAVDLPAAATQLAQGVGRLIRSPDDRGVVAVLDTRLATSRWRHAVLGALPPLRRCVNPDDVVSFLAES